MHQHAPDTCTRYMHQIYAPDTCTRYMHQIHAPDTCTRCMHQIHAPDTCTRYMHQMHAPDTCTRCMHQTHAPDTCTGYMHQIHAPDTWTRYMHQIHAPDTCTRYLNLLFLIALLGCYTTSDILVLGMGRICSLEVKVTATMCWHFLKPELLQGRSYCIKWESFSSHIWRLVCETFDSLRYTEYLVRRLLRTPF